MRIGYLPGVFDLLHNGHINIIQTAIGMCDKIVIGVHTDVFVSAYKRKPIQTQDERAFAILKHFGEKIHAIEIIGQFHLTTINKYGITHIFHGTDWELESYKKQIRYYEDNLNVSIEMIPYTQGISTSQIISDIDSYKNVDCVLFDLDNTLMLNGDATPHAVECVKYIQEHDIQIQVITNNNNHTPEQIGYHLRNCGMNIDDDCIYSSLKQTLDFLLANPQYKQVYVWGSDSAIQYLHVSGVHLTTSFESADVFVVLYRSEFEYRDLCNLLTHIKLRHVPYTIGNIDLTYPNKNTVLPDTGSIYNMIRGITDVKPLLVCGKPFPGICYIEPDKKYIMVGDSLITDAKLAENLNIHFFHKTDNNDLGVLLSKLKYSSSQS